MNEERFLEIMSDDDIDTSPAFQMGCNIMRGLKIIEKYIPGAGIEGASCDIVFSVNIDRLVNAGITEEDAIALRAENWMVEEEAYMACVV